MQPDITLADYIEYLCTMYGYYSALEPGLVAGDLGFFDSALELDKKRNVPLLGKDIDELCGRACLAYLPECRHLPLIGKPTEVVGCSYVIQGATLGASSIYRHLHKYLGVTPSSGAAFVYGRRT